MISDIGEWFHSMFVSKPTRRLTLKDYNALKGDQYKYITRDEAYKIFDGLWITPMDVP